ncbi:TRAM domain-containing protein [Candidatus Woesearchaeota archaeon]|nr:MAG: deoxyribonuclease/rho motif-like protein TRAM protein [archaeon GW2011_AR4]MBS3130362.1 TRAM domain-containing protein [Candidatus Woesearchaeota archaeon]HIH38227.1 TRAM domain-containing protein [Candidatus Woesearchaeota archaeon]HIH49814.1 TRAM domain-containing protein [Candidatus Woesearchaeota archaeon]HIJ04187.1 TRAM domain-containing protein [Candidatus Woesearchaeota archaeon]
MNRRNDSLVPPVRVGEEVDVRIEAVGGKGDGIAKIQGFVIFVPGTNEGDEVRVKVNKVLNKVGFGEVVGKAQGPIAGGSSPKRAADVVLPPADKDRPEDSEDFGEDDDEPSDDVDSENSTDDLENTESEDDMDSDFDDEEKKD